MKKVSLLILLIIGLFSCVPPEKDVITEINLDYKDPIVQKFYELQDRREIDSLINFTSIDDDTYQFLGARAFTAIPTDKAKSVLTKLLTDSNHKVAKAAIYAMSQYRSSDVIPLLQDAYDPYDTLLVRGDVNAAILTAIGKCGTENDLKNIVEISNFSEYDTVLIAGQLESVYRFLLEGKTSKTGSILMADALKNDKLSVEQKFWPASYFSRKKGIDIALIWPLKDYLQAFDNLDLDGQKSFIIGVGKTKSSNAFKFLNSIYNKTKSQEIKINIIRSFKHFDYLSIQPLIWKAIDDENNQIALEASSFFVNNGVPSEANRYWRKAKGANIDRKVSLNMYSAALKHMPYIFSKSINAIIWELKKLYRLNENDPVTQAQILMNISQMPWQYNKIARMGEESSNVIVKTGAIMALANIANRPDFEGYFNVSALAVKRILAQKFIDAINTGDVGMVSEAALALGNKKLNFAEVIDTVAILEPGLKRLKLPREVEGYNALVDAINTLAGQKVHDKAKIEYNQPIDWSLFNNLTDESRARIHTSKGIIEIKLLPEAAPGSVANFIQLVNAGYYDNKTFHRVIPNFVAQGGCPRGDGYGSLDYSIRSEFGQPFYNTPGKVGMASSGLDTEGTQWFITHCKLPHLDGRYTIFAEVTEGMDVVNKIEIGDRIDKISFIKM